MNELSDESMRKYIPKKHSRGYSPQGAGRPARFRNLEYCGVRTDFTGPRETNYKRGGGKEGALFFAFFLRKTVFSYSIVASVLRFFRFPSSVALSAMGLPCP